MRKTYFFKFTIIISIMLICLFAQRVYALAPSSVDIYDGIDVSQWQGEIDYAQVRNDGVEIVYIKATEGQNFIDPYFEENYINAKANGLKIGFYHFLVARTEEAARLEARHFVTTISGKEVDCKLAMDFESFGDLSVQEINNISAIFLKEVESLSGKKAVIYSDTSNARNIFSGELTTYPLWVAEYGVSEPQDNGKWEEWEGWQYTDSGRVSGINGNVDRDYFTKEILLEDNTAVAKPKPPVSNTEYVYIRVRRGETLSKIARDYNTTVEELVSLNNIPNPNLIFVNQTLRAPTVASGGNNNYIEYVVKSGDTLNRLALEFGTTVNAIVNLNNIQDPKLIYVDQRLQIPKAQNSICENYTVQSGDTLTSIARRYSTTVGEIAKANGIKNVNVIMVGEVLRICR